jgi:hypothetical protein
MADPKGSDRAPPDVPKAPSHNTPVETSRRHHPPLVEPEELPERAQKRRRALIESSAKHSMPPPPPLPVRSLGIGVGIHPLDTTLLSDPWLFSSETQRAMPTVTAHRDHWFRVR